MTVNINNFSNLTLFPEQGNIPTSFAEKLEKAVQIITPLLICIGLPGNVLAASVFLSKQMRTMSSSIYLAAIAIVRILDLFCMMLMWLWKLDVDVFKFPFLCYSYYYLNHACAALAMWFLMGFVVEQFLIVCFPLLAGRLCISRRAAFISLGMTISGLLFYSSVITQTWSINGKLTFCFLNSVLWFEVTSILIDSLIPYLVIIILCAIVLHTMHRAHLTQVLSQNNPSDTSYVGRGVREMHFQVRKRITRLLLAVCCSLLLASLPCQIYRVYIFVYMDYNSENLQSRTKDLTYDLYAVEMVLRFPYYCQYVLNFYLYVVLAGKFRAVLKNVICGKVRREPKQNTTQDQQQSVATTTLL